MPTGVLRLFHAYRSFARREALACIAIFLLALTLRLALLPWLPVPKPTIHDDFSYLLAADTYAHGRLANAPHPFWQHFETFQETQQPTYASKYQPLQGMALALGQVLFHLPWAGVLLTAGLMCAAICWMLQAWISAEWALLGAILFTLRAGVLSYWMNSYEGGAIPAIGGALALGAIAHIWRRRKLRHAITLALGLSIVMLSRPYDAAVLALAGPILLAILLRKEGARTIFTRVAIPAALVLALTFGFIAYNDYRVTGNALTLPYQAHDRQYVVASTFLPVPLASEPPYHHSVMRDFYAGWMASAWREARAEPVVQLLGRIYILIAFFFPCWPVAVLLLLSPLALTTAERVGCVLTAVGFASVAPLAGVYPHYAAVFAGVFYLRFLQGLARLAIWRESFGALLALLVVAMFLFAGRDGFSRVLAGRAAHFGAARDAMNRTLSQMPGKQLVLVRYAPGHNTQEEWVFNAADIDASKVIWAREMTAEQDRPFLEYFHDRQTWLAEPDHNPPLLAPYSTAEAIKEARR